MVFLKTILNRKITGRIWLKSKNLIKQEQIIEMKKFNEIQPIFNIKLSKQTENIVFDFRKKSFFFFLVQ